MSVARALGGALSFVIAEPSLWLLGSAGFLVRGGVALLALPILTLPSPVGIATLLGPAVVNSGRLEGPLLAAVVGALAFIGILCVGGLIAGAWIEIALFESFMGDPETAALRADRVASAGLPPLAALVGVEVVALLPVLAAAYATVGAIVEAVRAEILLPGDLAVPLPVRAAAEAAGPLLLLAASLVLAEALNGALSRRVLLGRRVPAFPVRRARSAGRHVLGTVATSVAGWLLAIAVLVPTMVLLLITWAGANEALLNAALADLELGAPTVVSIAASLLFVAAWLGAIVLGGILSALRGALWTGHALSGQGGWTEGGN